MEPKAGRQLQAVRTAGQRDTRTAPRPPDRTRARRNWRGIKGTCGSISELLEILGDRVKLYAVMRAELGSPRRIRHAAHVGDNRRVRRYRRRGADRARGNGRNRHHGGYIKRTPARDFPRAEPRRQGPRGHGDQGRGRRHRTVRDEHPYAGPVLLHAWQGLSHEGLAPAGRRAEHARTADGQPAAAGRRRNDLDRPPSARGRGRLGRPARHVRDRKGNVRRNSMDLFTNIPKPAKSR